jgi:hypothetical protein
MENDQQEQQGQPDQPEIKLDRRQLEIMKMEALRQRAVAGDHLSEFAYLRIVTLERLSSKVGARLGDRAMKRFALEVMKDLASENAAYEAMEKAAEERPTEPPLTIEG